MVYNVMTPVVLYTNNYQFCEPNFILRVTDKAPVLI